MQNSLNSRTLLSTTIADALDLFPGRSTRATGFLIKSPLSTGGDEGEGETGKAHLKSKMGWDD